MNRPRWFQDPDRPRSAIAVRVYRALLRLGPRRFRLTEAEGMAWLFSELQADRVARRGRLAGITGLFAELPGLTRTIAAAWRAERQSARRSSTHTARDRGLPVLDTTRQDLKAAARFLRRAPLLATIAVVTIALGVGANTAMFSLVHGVLLKPLAMPDPGQLVVLGEATPSSPPRTLNATSVASFLFWKESVHSASGMAAYSGRMTSVTGLGEPEAIVAINTAGGFFDVMGVRPLFGRTLLPSDELPGAAPVLVLSYNTWQHFFGEDRGVLGRTMMIDRAPVTIVGIMPQSFTFPFASTGFWQPARFTPQERANRDQYYLAVVARLRPGATMGRLQSELDATAQALRRDWSQYNTKLAIHALPLQEAIVGDSRSRLVLLMGAVGLVLLITCANLASLMMARASARRREVAVRQALGAGWSRIVRQLLTESIVLSVLGGIAAIGAGLLLMRLLIAAMRDTLPRIGDISFDPTVLAFTLALSVLTGMVFGLAPAIQLARGRSSEVLRERARTGGTRQAGRQTLVVLQLAMALMLLTGAGLLMRSFALLTNVRPGFDPANLLSVHFTAPQGNPSFVDAVLDRVRALPGVTSASVISQIPATGRGNGAWFNVLNRPVPPGSTPPAEAYRVISYDALATARIPLLRGRMLTSNDGLRGTPSVAVNAALARKYWPNGDALGQDIYLGAPDNRLFDHATIVGVVGDTREAGLGLDPIPVVYGTRELMPWWPSFDLLVRTSGEPMAMLPAVRREIRALDPLITLREPKAVASIMRESLATNRWSLILLASFAGVAVAMAALGVFGVLSYLVAQRTRELGIRLALGATPSRLRGMVVSQGMRLAALGLVLGLVGAYALNGWIRGLLFGVKSTDPLTYLTVAVMLVVVAGLASWIPARRSTRVDPTVALRDG